MLQLIVGEKGSGKTRKMVEMMNEAAKKTAGNIVCIEKSQKLMFDLDHSIRLMDTESNKIESFRSLYGFILGVLASDYDIHEIYVDDILKICGMDMDEFAEFAGELLKITADREVTFIFNATCEKDTLPESLKKYVIGV